MTARSPQHAVDRALSALVGERTRGIGVDIVDVAALGQLVVTGGPSFLDAYWTVDEQHDSGRDTERLAARWAGKEAVMKALGAGIGEIDPIDIELRTLPTGAPIVGLHRSAKQVADRQHLADCRVSLTHDSGWAVAVAVAVAPVPDMVHG